MCPHKDAAIPVFSAARNHLLVSPWHQDRQNHRSHVAVRGMTTWVGGAINQVHDRPSAVYTVIGGNMEIVRADNLRSSWLGLERARVAINVGAGGPRRKTIARTKDIGVPPHFF